jgi:hypothetical protein
LDALQLADHVETAASAPQKAGNKEKKLKNDKKCNAMAIDDENSDVEILPQNKSSCRKNMNRRMSTGSNTSSSSTSSDLDYKEQEIEDERLPAIKQEPPQVTAVVGRSEERMKWQRLFQDNSV